jgi:hypothetical protein
VTLRAPLLLLALVGVGCRGDETVTYSGETLLTVTAVPRNRTTTTPVQPIACAGTIQITTRDDGVVRGSFERTRCTGVVNPTEDVRGAVYGTRAADGTLALYFRPAPLATSEAVTTSGGCPEEPAAAGPFAGHLDGSSLHARSAFFLGCAGLPFPNPPSFDVEYRIDGTR